MLRIAIPNKGALSEAAVALAREAGYNCKRRGRELVLSDSANDAEFFFLRPRDIAVYVGSGVLDLGITGRDLAQDSGAEVAELMPLGFGHSSFHFAVPAESELTPEHLGDRRIATSYPNIVRQYMEKQGLNVKVIRLDGAVEISIRLGVADAIADVVESGRTLVEAGLKTIGKPIMKSEAILVAREAAMAEHKAVKTLMDRLRGILVAREYAMVEYDVPRDRIEQACIITPGIESPTIAPLSNPDWVAVKAMVTRKSSNEIMDQLKRLGAKGILVSDLRSCRL